MKRTWILWTILYIVIYFSFEQLEFPPRKDELHFWPTSQFFSQTFPPTLTMLRSYNDLNTPLPFLVFGALERVFHQGIWLGRLLNLLLSVAIVLVLSRRSVLSVVGLFLMPYFLAVSTHLYTDLFAACLSLFGIVLYEKRRFWLASMAFALAISSRQYAVVFPLTLLLQTFSWQMLLTVLVLPGWLILFGGPAPRIAMENQYIATAGFWSFLPQNSLYFLACMGIYFVLPETLLFRKWRVDLTSKRSLVLGLLLAIAFILFPPLENPARYPFHEFGYFDKGVRLLLGNLFRMLLYLFLAWVAAVRFLEWNRSGLIVFIYAALMAKAHIAWDKYALLPIIPLWWLRGINGEENYND